MSSNQKSFSAVGHSPQMQINLYSLLVTLFILQVNNLAAGLLAMGFKKGDRVGMWGPNMREWVITQFATAKAGLILVSALRPILANGDNTFYQEQGNTTLH